MIVPRCESHVDQLIPLRSSSLSRNRYFSNLACVAGFEVSHLSMSGVNWSQEMQCWLRGFPYKFVGRKLESRNALLASRLAIMSVSGDQILSSNRYFSNLACIADFEVSHMGVNWSQEMQQTSSWRYWSLTGGWSLAERSPSSKLNVRWMLRCCDEVLALVSG